MAKRAASATLAAATPAALTLTGGQGVSLGNVEVINRAAQEVWVSFDGSTPAVAADESYVLPGQVGARLTVRDVPFPVTVRALAAAAGALTAQHTGG